MVPYYGDYPEDHAEIRIPFNTFDSNDPSASVTITNLADADIMVHADGSLTQIVTDGASVIINFDGITGNHMILIDSSVDAAYTTATEYAVRIEGTTVDAATINAWIGTFSIERAGGVLALIKAGNLSSNVVQISGDATAADNAELFFDDTGFDASNSTIGTVTTNTDLVTAAVIADAVWDEVITGAAHGTATTAGRRLLDLASMIIRSDTAQGPGTGNNQIQFDASASATDGAYDPAIVSIVGGTGPGQTRLILQYDGTSKTATVDRNWKVNPDATSEFVILGNPGREHVNEGLAQAGAAGTITLNTLASSDDNAYNGQTVFIRSGTGEDQARFVTAYNGTTKVATVDRNWDANPDSTSGYVMLATSVFSSSQMAGATWDALRADHVVSNSFGERVLADMTAISGDTTAADRLEGMMDGLVIAQVNDASATTTDFAADGFTEATDDHFNGRLITFISGTLAAQQTDITDYDAADGAQGSQQFTVTALTSAPGDGDFFMIH